VPQGTRPLLPDCSLTIAADIDVPSGGAEGMIITAGYGFYLLKVKAVLRWNLVDLRASLIHDGVFARRLSIRWIIAIWNRDLRVWGLRL
jgi:arylsulfatase